MKFNTAAWDDRRNELPYGRYTTSTGGQYLFNRRYQPILTRPTTSGEWRADVSRDAWVVNINEALTVHFYRDGHSERMKVTLAMASSNWV